MTGYGKRALTSYAADADAAACTDQFDFIMVAWARFLEERAAEFHARLDALERREVVPVCPQCGDPGARHADVPAGAWYCYRCQDRFNPTPPPAEVAETDVENGDLITRHKKLWWEHHALQREHARLHDAAQAAVSYMDGLGFKGGLARIEDLRTALEPGNG